MDQLPLPFAVPRDAGPTANRSEPPAPAQRAKPELSDGQPPVQSQRLDPTDMALRGRIGAYRLRATHDPRGRSRKARERFMERFGREVDPDGVLPDDEQRGRRQPPVRVPRSLVEAAE